MKTTRPIVLLDCDGVLADFVGGLLGVIREVTGRTHTSEQITHFDFATSLGLTRDEGAAVKRWLGDSRGWCASLRPCLGAVEGVRALREVAEVYVVTSPWNSCPTWMYEREEWLWRRFDIPHANVLHCSAKHLVAGDVFVDDKTSAVAKWQAAHPRDIAIQWRTPHNRLDDWDGLSTSAWPEVIERVAVRGRWPR